MIQTLNLPVLSLDIPNIQKLNTINADDLSCMWTVFSKCKESLENGRRLENMSWRLWYRQTSLKESEKSTCPIPILKKEADKDISSTSFKRIISSLNDNKITKPVKSEMASSTIKFSQSVIADSHSIAENNPKPQPIDNNHRICAKNRPTIQKETPNLINKLQKAIVLENSEHAKFFIKDDEEQGWSSEDEDEQDLTPKNSVNFINSRSLTGTYVRDETEFKKISPIPVNIPTKPSILSNMLHADYRIRLAQHTHVTQNQQKNELSSSMKRYIQREQDGLGYEIIFNTKNESSFDVFEPSFRDYW